MTSHSHSKSFSMNKSVMNAATKKRLSQRRNAVSGKSSNIVTSYDGSFIVTSTSPAQPNRKTIRLASKLSQHYLCALCVF